MAKNTTLKRKCVHGTGYKVRAVVSTDDAQHKVRFCAAEWLETLTLKELKELKACGWSGRIADEAALYAAESRKVRGVVRLFQYLTTWKPRTLSGYVVGFEVQITAFDVYHHLRRKRPEWVRKLFKAVPEFKAC